MNNHDLTWRELLINKGVNPNLSNSLIGFISWNEGENYNNLGKEINDVLNGYEGKIFAKDVVSDKHLDKGILFMNSDISEDDAKNVFEVIMDYEEDEYYDL